MSRQRQRERWWTALLLAAGGAAHGAALPLSGVESTAAGQSHTCAVVNGGVQCWGEGSGGQLGHGSYADSGVPVRVFGAGSGATAVAAGATHSCAVLNGGVQCWGQNDSGKLGNNSITASNKPVVAIPAGSGATAVSAGSTHTCALVDGGVQCWGNGANGMLGNGSTAISHVPVVAIAAGSGVTAVRAGGSSSCAVSGGGVQCWGNGGQLGDGTNNDSSVPVVIIPAGSGATALGGGRLHTCAVVNGGVRCWGANVSGGLGDGSMMSRLAPVTALPEGSGATDVAPGSQGDHTCAVALAGVRCWGGNATGQVGIGTPTVAVTVPNQTLPSDSGATLVAVGQSHSCAVVSGGMRCWGENDTGQLSNGTLGGVSAVPRQVYPAGSGATAVAAGTDYTNLFGHTCAVLNGGVQCWGSDSHGQLGDGAATYTPLGNATNRPVTALPAGSGATAVAAGSEHTCAILNGAVSCWGNRSGGVLGDGVGVFTANVPSPTPSLVTSGATVIAAGRTHTCAVVKGGLQCWGSAQLGDGSSTATSTPVAVLPESSGVTSVAAGDQFTCVLANGGVQCWGVNLYGQLGNGSNDASPTPVVTLPAGSGATALAAGQKHACAVVSGGVRCWGAGVSGNLGNGGTSNSNVPVVALPDGSGATDVAAGASVSFGDYTCAIVNGGVRCWGDNAFGQIGNGTLVDTRQPLETRPDASGVTAIGGGALHVCAVIDGGVRCWGRGATGELGDGKTGFAASPFPVMKSQTELLQSTLDVDRSVVATKYDALTDGIQLVRGLFGVSGASLTANAIGPTATRTFPPDVEAYLGSMRIEFDIDDNGDTDALTDGLLIIRYLFGIRGSALVKDAVGPSAQRATAQAIEDYLATLLP